MLRTSILDRLCGPLCDAVIGKDEENNSSFILEHLERANLFIVPLDNERHWYRYHHLFGDLLRQRINLSVAGKKEELAEYHRRASVWYEENGYQSESFHHAIAARDFARAAGLAELAWQGMDGTFQSAAWLGWVKKIPDDVIRAMPVLCTQAAYAFMDAGDVEASESRLQDAERLLNGSPDEMVVVDKTQLRVLPALIAMARAYNAQVQSDFATTIKYAELALQLVPEDDFLRRAQATATLELNHWALGELEAAARSMVDWMNNMQKVGNVVFIIASAFALADIQIAQGRLREADKTYRQALQLAAEHGKDAEQITAHHHLGLAMLDHEMQNDESAEQHLQRARELGEQTTLVDWQYRWRVAQAQLKESSGELDAALDLLDEAKRVYVRTPIPNLRPIEALKTRIYLQQGKLSKALDWVRERGLSVDDEVSYLREFEHLTLARVLIAEYKSNHSERSIVHAIGLLDRLLKAAEEQKRIGSVIEILIMQALACQAQGNLPLALASLERAIILTEPEGYVRIFVDEGKPMQRMIYDLRFKSAAHPAGIENQALAEYVDRLWAAFPAAQSKTRNPKSEIQNHKFSIIEPLSERELEVLRLIAQGLSNREISERLVLALSTVKGHNLKIFGKLQVTSRTEAIARARELGLV